MASWADPIRRALDSAGRPISIYFRDDDAGWSDDRLAALLDRFDEAGVPVDLAVIPDSLSTATAKDLRARHDCAALRLGLHVHGRSHTNHEQARRKSEFGTSRDVAAQARDLAAAAASLACRLGADAVDPIFTPPWNRCSEATFAALRALGFAAISRTPRAQPVAPAELIEIPVHVDWHREIRAGGGGLETLGAGIGRALTAAAEHSVVGLMLHHATMTDCEFEALRMVLALLAAHGAAHCIAMRELL